MAIENETPEETLKRVGETQPITSASAYGKSKAVSVLYPTDYWKNEQRLAGTGVEKPEDENGLGYDYTGITEEL